MMTRTKTFGILGIALMLTLAATGQAATVTWVGGTDDFLSTAGNWSDATAPSAGNDYVVDGVLVRPDDVDP